MNMNKLNKTRPRARIASECYSVVLENMTLTMAAGIQIFSCIDEAFLTEPYLLLACT